jgi:hypothetical protein
MALELTEFCTEGCDKGPEHVKLKNFHGYSPFSRERLVKTQQAGKGLAGAVVNCKVCRSPTALQLRVVRVVCVSGQ